MKIYKNDAYKIVTKFKKDKLLVDHIITDPPYNISKENNFSTMKSSKRKGVDFGEWDKGFDLYSWITPYCHFLKPGGSFIIFTSFRNISYVVDTIEHDKEMQVKDVLKWIKTNPMPRNVNRRYVQDTEYAIWAVKRGSAWVFNKPDSVPYIRAEFHTPVVAGKERTIHPTQKSLKLMKEIIKIHTNEEQVILDPFMGSGTTGVAALELNRKFIGIEISEKYFEISKERLNHTNETLDLWPKKS